ncbi:MAG: hypothetical protein HRT71_04625 [Flavobacteriales bacterium]|nr:hypothetical protein [Flavobacteriales bacterium]
MIRETEKDKIDSVSIIADAFDANPSVNLVIGDKGSRSKKINRLAEYAFIKALNREGAFLSDNKMGTALCYRSNVGASDFKEFISEMRFALSIPVLNVIRTLKREGYLSKNRFGREHFYFWFLGVQKGGGKAGFELKDHLFLLADKEQLSILMETSVERNKVIYERYGFKVYHEWTEFSADKTLWFMKRDPK